MKTIYHYTLAAVIVSLMTVISIVLCASVPVKENKFDNMVDVSVLVYDDYNYGSGVFIGDNIVLTAAHYLRCVDNTKIELSDGTILESSDFYIDEKEDVGFIYVDADELHIANISNMPGDIGDTVYLVGAPYVMDLKFTITKGILSHLDRDILGLEGLIQTDAEGAPGSSGGPLYDNDGNVIGICVTGLNPGGGVTLCESGKSILEAYERQKEKDI